MSFTSTLIALAALAAMLVYLDFKFKIQRIEDKIKTEQRFMRIELAIDKLKEQANV